MSAPVRISDLRQGDAAPLRQGLATWLPRQRWFAAKERTVHAIDVVRWTALATQENTEAGLVLCLVRVTFTDGASHLYHLPLALDGAVNVDGPEVVGADEDTRWRDALADPDAVRRLLRLMADATDTGNVRMWLDPTMYDLAVGTPAVRQVSVEQSNTSLIVADRLILKVYRLVSVGVNPDLELQEALGRAGSPHIAGLVGVVEDRTGREPVTLAMAQPYAAGVDDAWQVAQRRLADLPGDDLLGDFAIDSYGIGQALGAVHRDLSRELGSRPMTPDDFAALIGELTSEFEQIADVAPQLVRHADAVQRAYAQAARVRTTQPVQRIHGDLHLGQLLRTPHTWWLLDFEGEPSRLVAARRQQQSPLRDVAGLLRSLDYAVRFSTQSINHPDEVRLHRWQRRARQAFFTGYTAVSGHDPRAETRMLRALEIARAVYEVGYEARNRPSWVGVPLAAVRRLAGS